MTRKPTTTDGFVIPRRPRSTSNARIRLDKDSSPARTAGGIKLPPASMPIKAATMPKSTLPDLDALPPTGLTGKKDKKRGFRFRKPSKRTVKWTIIIVLLILLGIGGYFAYKFLSNSGKIFKGNPITAILSQGKDLKVDPNGRSNILLFGTSEDDPDHDGANLTDSIMLVSIDQKKKDAFLISIPRDLYVDYGKACPSGYKGKINVVYLCSQEESGEDAGQEAIRAKVGDVLGLDIQYSVHLNYTVLRQAVDAVGGITVKIESQDPRGILDRNFDWDCPNGNGSCHNVKYPNGDANLNGKQALYLARARGADPLGRTYGLPQANFDRENYQRKILIALKDKAAGIGTLANPVAVTKLLDALGENVRTNFDAEEIKTLVKVGNELKNENIKSISLVDKEKPLVTTGNVNGESIVRPIPSLFDYSQIQRIVLAYATGDTSSLEGAIIDVLNVTSTPGVAQIKAEELAKAGLKIGKVANGPETLNTAAIQIFDNSKGSKPGTLEKLKKTYGVTPTEGLPAGITSTADFVILVGSTPATQ